MPANRVQSSIYPRQARAVREQEAARRERRAAYDREHARLPVRRLYQTDAWRSLRAAQLRQFPLCCEPGCRQRATVVDHVRPHRGDNSLFFDPHNLRSMCKRHHDRKTARFDGGFGNRKRYLDAPDESGFGLV